MSVERTFDAMMAQLSDTAKELHKFYGYSSLQICACVQTEDGSSTAVFAGAGSVHERTATTREFVQRSDEITLQAYRRQNDN